MSEYHGPGWGLFHVHCGFIFGDIILVFICILTLISSKLNIEEMQTLNIIKYLIIVLIVTWLLEYIILKIDRVDAICKILDCITSEMSDKYCLQKLLLKCIGVIIEVSIIWGSLAVIKHYANIDLKLMMCFAGMLLFAFNLIYGFVVCSDVIKLLSLLLKKLAKKNN